MSGASADRERRPGDLDLQGIVNAALCTLLAAAATACAVGSPSRATGEARLDGTIVEGRYTAPDGSFSVAAPHEVGSYELQNLRIDDGHSSDGNVEIDYVIFGPGPTDPTSYHVIVANVRARKGDRVPFADRVELIVASYVRGYDERYGGRAERLVLAEMRVRELPAMYVVYRYEYEDAIGPRVFYMVSTVVKINARQIANLMAERLTMANPWFPGSEALVAREWQRFNDLVGSLEVAE